MIWKFISVLILSSSTVWAAEVVELPREELAQESVLPVFDNPVATRNRSVVTEGRSEVGLNYGLALTEPIANVSKVGLAYYYHLNEDHAFGLSYFKNFPGQSDYAKQLNTKYQLDFSRAPAPDYALMADYNLKMFYGKISISKSAVLNVSFFSSASLGTIRYTHKNYPAAAVGIGQRFYFTPQWAFRFDLRLLGHQAPIPFLAGNPGIQESTTKPNPENFSERMTYTTNLDLGFSYLF